MRDGTHVEYFLNKYFVGFCDARGIDYTRFRFVATRVQDRVVIEILDQEKGDYFRLQVDVSPPQMLARSIHKELDRWHTAVAKPNEDLLKEMKSFIRNKYGI